MSKISLLSLDLNTDLSTIQTEVDKSFLNSLLLGDTTLTKKQEEKVQEAFIKRRVVLEAEPGLGKTYNIIGWLQCIYPFMEEGQFVILIVLKSKITEFEDLIKSATSYKSVTTTGAGKELQSALYALINGISNLVICTPEAWKNSIPFKLFMYNKIPNIKAIAYDESSGIDAESFKMICAVSKWVPFVLASNGTPISRNYKLIYNLIDMVGGIRDLKMDEVGFRMKFVSEDTSEGAYRGSTNINVEAINKVFGEYFVGYNRSELGITVDISHCQMHLISPTEKQWTLLERYGKYSRNDLKVGFFNKEPSAVIKDIMYSPETYKRETLPLATTETAAFNKLMEILQKKEPNESIIVFIKNIASCSMVEAALKEQGQHVYVLTGARAGSKKKKDAVREAFNADLGSILLTNDEKGNNLGSATHVVIYGLPESLPQFIARITRGFEDLSISIDLIHYYILEEVMIRKSMKDIDLVERKTARSYNWRKPLEDTIKKYYPNYYI